MRGMKLLNAYRGSNGQFMFEFDDPDSKGHTLTRGTLIGKNWGRVAEINQDCVVIKEEYRDYTGRKVTNKTPMCLPKPQELKLD